MSFRAIFLLVFATTVFGQQPEPRPYFTEPSLSPDRKEIAFVSGGDIWTVPATGGVAALLVSHAANEARPLYSPDGRQLAFISSRTGNGDLYLLTLATGELKRLTFDDSLDQLDGWSRDGRWIYFSSTSRDVGNLNDLFRVSVNGGTPMSVSADRYTNEFYGVPSPDGKTLAFSARGIASGQWWRNGHSHIDETELWLLRSFEGAGTYEKVTSRGAKELWPMWSADGRNLFYVSDRNDSGNKNGAQNIWSITPGKSDARRVSNFTDGRLLWPSISYDGREIVFEHNFAIWKLDTESGKAAEVSITRRGASPGPGIERVRLNDQIAELQLSPDGKKVAFVVRGEVFAASAADGGDAARVSNSYAEEYQLAWSPDSRRLVYVSERDAIPHLFLYDFTAAAETQLTRDPAGDSTPRFSPDGKLLAFIRGAKDLRVMDIAAKTDRVVASGYFERAPLISDRPFAWSPDSKWLAYLPVSDNQFRNVNIVSVDGGAGRPASFLANVFSNSVSWSPDGAFMLFDTGQRTESSQLARVDLIPRTPRFREDQFRDLFREETPRNLTPSNRPEPRPSPTPSEAPAPSPAPSASPGGEDKRPAPKPVQVVFEDIRRRLSFLPIGLDVNYQTISPDGKWVALIANAANQANIYIYSIDELSREPAVAKQLTSTSGFKRWAQFSPDSKEIFYIENGRIGAVNLEGRARTLAVTAEMDVDFSREKMEMFRQGWSYIRDFFYDSDFHGVNWQGVRAQYEPLIAGARTADEMRRLLNMMVGELNASHLGAGAQGAAPTTGRIGLRFDRSEYETSGRLRITEVIPLSPAAIAGTIKAGDYLHAVDGRTIDQTTNLDETLNYKINRRVSLTVSSDGTTKREVVVRPINGGTERGLLYRQWVERNREYVAKASNGRLGYVHMFDMSTASLNQLHIDLDAENYAKDGVVIDIRNNSGGFVNVYAIDVFARRPYLTMTLRGLSATPARTVLGQRALNRPTILVTNQHSLSDAEDFSEGYRTLRLGQVVGEPTAGWIIYTWGQSLIDGTSFRLPRMKITANDGTNMERNPRPVDVEVTRPIGETLTNRDSQLDAAVRELLKQLGTSRSTSPR